MEKHSAYIIYLAVSLLLIFIGKKKSNRKLKLYGIIATTFLTSIPILGFIAGIIDGVRGR